jgi:dTDP-4-dehydrorhamnose 3,5-epimerase
MLYCIDTPYAPDHAAGLAWDDPALTIAWPHAAEVLSERDRAWPTLAELVP